MNKILKNFISIFLGNIFSRVLSFAIIIYLARNFGPADFGIINFSSAYITYFSMLASFGLSTYGIVSIAKDRSKTSECVNEILSIKIILSILSYLLLVGSLLIIQKDYQVKSMILLSGITILTTSFSVDWVFNALQEMKYISYSIIINSVLSFLILVSFIFLGNYRNIYIVPISTAIASIISSFYLYVMYLREAKDKFNFKINIPRYVEIIKLSLPFFFSGIFATVNLNIDTIILGFIKSDVEVGLYNSVYKIVNVLVLFVSFIFTPIYPVLIDYFAKKKLEELEKVVNNLRKIVYILAVPLAVSALTLSHKIMLFLYGKEYESASFVFLILICYVSILLIREIYGYELTAWNLQNKYMRIVLISSSYNFISNIILIPRFGINAAAINTFISEIINLIFMFRLSRNTLKIQYKNTIIIKIILSGCLTYFSIIILKNIVNNVIILLALEVVIYCGGLFLFKCITIDEIKQLLHHRR